MTTGKNNELNQENVVGILPPQDIIRYVYEYGLDIPARTIYLFGDITEEIAHLFNMNFNMLASIDEEQPIQIILSSNGGSVSDGLSIFDTIMQSPVKTHMLVTGKALSMGLIIALAGDVRTAHPNTRFMAHSVSSITEGKVETMKTDVLETDTLNDTLLEILSKRTSKKKNFWKKQLEKKDYYFDTEEAIKLGVLNV